MKLRVASLTAFGTGVCAVAFIAFAVTFGQAQSFAPRQSFEIATGPTGGTYFPVGQLIAGVVSHPPGVDRCQIAFVCGPDGLIMSARTSDGSIANVLDVNASRVDSGLAQADIVEEAVKGRGAFRRYGRQTHIRVLADLFDEDVHLVVAVHAHIARVADLRGKRVSLGAASSGTSETAREILTAYGLSDRTLKLRRVSADVASAQLQAGKLDAFFFVGGVPVPLVDDLIARGAARLVPIDGPGRDKAMRIDTTLGHDTIAAGLYQRTPAIETLRVRAVWIVRDSTPAPVVYGIARSLFNSSNRAQFDAAMPATRAIRIDDALDSQPAPVHPGALRFYREMGKLPRVTKI